MMCIDCGQDLPDDHFLRKARKNTTAPLGACRKCRWSTTRNYRNANPARRLLHSCRARAKVLGLEFNLTVDDLAVPTHCPVFGIPLTMGYDRRTENTPSVDRIDPSRGYVRGNIAVVSWRANRLKSNATAAELEALAAYTRNVK